MNFPRWFQWIWWALLFLAVTLYITDQWNPKWLLYDQQTFRIYYTLFILWLILILVPIFSEISIFGFGVKREVQDIKRQLKHQYGAARRYWLGNDLASLRFQAILLKGDAKARELIEWQGEQAINHARAAEIPKAIIDSLQALLRRYRSDFNEEQLQQWANDIVDIQKQIAQILSKEDESALSTTKLC